MCEYCTDDIRKRKKFFQPKDDTGQGWGTSWFIKDQCMGDLMPRVMEVCVCDGIYHQSLVLVPIRCCPNCGKEFKPLRRVVE